MDWKVIDLSHSLPLSLSLLLSFSDYQPTYLPIYLSIYLSTYLSISFSSYQTSYLSLSIICLNYFMHLSNLSIYLSIHPSIYYLSATRNDISTSKSGPNVVCFVHFDFENVLRTTTACIFSTSQLPKAVRTSFVLYILTSKMCFAPQRRAFFRHHHFQKRSERGVFCTFWLQNVLHATTACAFLTSQLSKLVRAWCALCILTWKRASRHNGVHFFDILTSKSGPTLVCFVHFDLEMCFAPQRRATFHLSSEHMAPHPPL